MKRSTKQFIEKVNAKKRLEYLRGEIENERISGGEIIELMGLAPYIPRDDVVLLEWAGVPEASLTCDHANWNDYFEKCDDCKIEFDQLPIEVQKLREV